MTKAQTKTKPAAKAKAAPAQPVDVASPATEATPAASAATQADLLHHEIRPDPQNPRKDFESEDALEALQELKASIVADDLLENLVVRPAPEGLGYMLIAGERRWRAIGLAIAEGLWATERRIPCSIRVVDEKTARRLALVENLQRRDLNYMEEARSLSQLCELEDKTASQVGEELGFTPRWGQQRIQLLQLTEPLQARLERREIKLEEAREILGMWSKLPPIKRTELERGVSTVAEVKLWLNNQPKPLELAADEWALVLEVFDKVQREPLADSTYLTECHADARFDDRVKGFASWPRYMLNSVSHLRDNGGPTGRFQIGTSHDTLRQLRLKFGGEIDSEAGRLRALDSLYDELGVVHTAPSYHTPWLNGPFTIAEGLRQEIDNARAAEAERDARWAKENAERAAENKRRTDAYNAQQAAIDANHARATELLPIYTTEHLAEALAIISSEHPLPWAWREPSQNEIGGPCDANGQWIQLGENTPAERMMTALINSLGGHSTKVTAGEEDEEAGGADGDDAPAAGEQLDVEDAIAAAPDADDDPELSPSLIAMATGEAKPIAQAEPAE